MTFGKSHRLVDSRIEEFGEDDLLLLDMSPSYTFWRRRILDDGKQSRLGYRLGLDGDLYAELQGLPWGQPVAFGANGLPATRVLLNHARPVHDTRALAHDTCEHYYLQYDVADEFQQVARVVDSYTPITLDRERSVQCATVLTTTDKTIKVELRRIGTKRAGTFRSNGTPLDVLKIKDQNSFLVDGEIIALKDLPLDHAGLEAHLKRLSFLPAPAARQMMRMMADGRLPSGVVDREILDSALSDRSFWPQTSCLLCSKAFKPQEAPEERERGIYWKVCPDCRMKARKGAHSAPVDVAEPLTMITELAAALGKIPPSQWREDLRLVEDADQYLGLVRFALRMPSMSWYTSRHGSWFHALVAAGVIPEATQRMVLGYRTLAVDGHTCFSLGEKTIDDWLRRNEVDHTREPHYPDSRYRADFLVGRTLVEYFGLAGNGEYDRKTAEKRRLAASAGIDLVEITPADLATWDREQHRVAHQLGFVVRAPGSPGRR